MKNLNQNWMVVKGDRISFPGGGTHFHYGAAKYIASIANMLNFSDDNLNDGDYAQFLMSGVELQVLVLIFRGMGDLWSGSEGAAIMIWQWEAISKARSVTSEERHMAALVLEWSFVDLKSQVSVNGACNNIFSYDIKFLMNDHAGAKVWSAGYLSFALWYTSSLLSQS